jgi:hypothetical protein
VWIVQHGELAVEVLSQLHDCYYRVVLVEEGDVRQRLNATCHVDVEADLDSAVEWLGWWAFEFGIVVVVAAAAVVPGHQQIVFLAAMADSMKRLVAS